MKGLVRVLGRMWQRREHWCRDTSHLEMMALHTVGQAFAPSLLQHAAMRVKGQL